MFVSPFCLSRFNGARILSEYLCVLFVFRLDAGLTNGLNTKQNKWYLCKEPHPSEMAGNIHIV